MLCSLLTEHFFDAVIEGCEEPRGPRIVLRAGYNTHDTIALIV